MTDQKIQVYLGKSPTVKTTVTLPSDLVEEFRKISESQGISLSEAIRQALELDSFVRDGLKQGGALYLQKEEGGPMIKVELFR